MEMEMIGSSTQINFFINNTLLQADSKAILKLVPFIEDGFVPSFGEEVTENNVKNKIFRIEKEFDGFNYIITFGTQVVSFQFDTPSIPVQDDLFDNFRQLLDKLINVFHNELPLVNRVSVVINQGYHYHSDLDVRLHGKFFKPQVIPSEWNFRRAIATEFENIPIYHVIAITKGHAIINIRGEVSEKETILLTVDNNVDIGRVSKKFKFDDLSFISPLFLKSVSDFYSTLEG